MTPQEFLADFESTDFPQIVGPWKTRDDHDPPFLKSQLRAMAKQGLIQLDETQWRYRLTLKAAYEVAKEPTP